MDIRDHGVWERYTPAKPPEGAPASAMFARRTGDGVDWYDYVNAGHRFAKDTVKMTVVNGAVAAATTDPTALFPAGATVLEVSDTVAGNPQELFGRKLYDAHNKTFRDPPAFSPAVPIAEILARLKALEDKDKGP
jgi:hypothetical protein